MGRARRRKRASGIIRSWSDLARLIEQVALERTTWIFRGEPSDTYELRPACGRQGNTRGSVRTIRYDVADERAALKRFIYDAQPYVGFAPNSEMEWLAIAQHHGMATRLLDWTESLLVAAFFAVEQAENRDQALIYGAAGLPVLDPERSPDPFDVPEVTIYRPRHIDVRIAAQRSVFTVHPDPTAAFDFPGLHSWTITRKACLDLKLILDSCAINYASMFPDIEGLARHVGWRYRWGMSQGHVPA